MYTSSRNEEKIFAAKKKKTERKNRKIVFLKNTSASRLPKKYVIIKYCHKKSQKMYHYKTSVFVEALSL